MTLESSARAEEFEAEKTEDLFELNVRDFDKSATYAVKNYEISRRSVVNLMAGSGITAGTRFRIFRVTLMKPQGGGWQKVHVPSFLNRDLEAFDPAKSCADPRFTSKWFIEKNYIGQNRLFFE